MNHDQFQFYFSPKYMLWWDSKELPSAMVDYSFENIKDYKVEFIAFAPDVLEQLNPDFLPAIIDEARQCVAARVVAEVGDYNNWLNITLDALGLKRTA